ncbi:similar to DSBA-like thioredoxin domain protein [Botrytis cinerea T4]|uniref:Similar to DSBA-like thioredoxin domain protein n=1 Tax=Botryotinia fuckeliana (strain T4) TaxID=999810 RepID=G2XNX2_BOTF4|nr:similar to DSBA-like thioredoxin domain protein [Botrytis cinerea T4]
MTKFEIEIVSDTVCPWCYVGKQKLEQGITAYKQRNPDSNDTFSITWHPFYLAPDAPKTGVDKRAYLVARLGEQRLAAADSRLSQLGRDVGINFKFGGKTGASRTSHRLIQLGKTKSPAMQTKVVESLFKSYFEEEGDITSHEVLRNAGVRAGLDEKEVTEWLESEKGGAEVDREVEEARRNSISGVPNFTIQGKYEVGGAQDSAVFLRLFEKIKGMEESSKA